MNLQSVVAERAESTSPALIAPGDAGDLDARDIVVTFAELAARSADVHRVLGLLGIEPGDRVALLAGTTVEFVTALFGILRAGAVAVPLNPIAPATEVQRELDIVQAAAVFAGPMAQPALDGVATDAPIVAIDQANIAASTPLHSLVEQVQGADLPPPVERSDSDLALLLFTSGTAGTPKAAMLSHGNLLANIEQLDAHPSPIATETDIALGVLPLFHILGLNVLLGTTLHAGAAVVLVERFDPIETASLVERHKVTVVAGPPAMWQAWAATPGVRQESFVTVRVAVSGAAPLTAEVAEAVQKQLGVRLEQGYGLTESSPALTLAIGTGAPATSVGRPIPGVTLRLVDGDGNDVPVGDQGEIWAKGDNIFGGYWSDPEQTAAVLSDDGWLRTGDIGVVDDHGLLYIVSRSKDLILVSGFNVHPAEVEGVLGDHPAVVEAAVIGVDDPRSGETVKAVVQLASEQSATEADIIGWCRERLAGYKCPTIVDFVNELPKTAVGKLRRRDLR